MFDDKIKEARRDRQAAVATAADLFRRAGETDLAERLETNKDVPIHDIARAVRSLDDNGLQSALRTAIDRYVEAYNTEREYLVKADIAEEFQRELEYQVDKHDLDAVHEEE